MIEVFETRPIEAAVMRWDGTNEGFREISDWVDNIIGVDRNHQQEYVELRERRDPEGRLSSYIYFEIPDIQGGVLYKGDCLVYRPIIERFGPKESKSRLEIFNSYWFKTIYRKVEES